ncbi:MAG: DUF4097 family beta strand repeat-containing protein [Acidobacteriota bacterium]
MTIWRSSCLILLALLLVAPDAWADRTEEETYEETVDLGAGGTVEVDTTNGSIRVETWDRDQVQVVARKKARARSASEAQEMLDAIEIKIRESGGTVRIEADLPRSRSGWFGGGTSANVAFELTIPADAELHASSNNGAIDVRDLGAPARLETQNGSIEADGVNGELEAFSNNGRIEADDVRGSVQAETTNGAIKVDISADALNQDVDLRTSNGSVELRLASSVAASIYARTRNGSVSSDFPGGVQDERRRSLELELNGGGPQIELKSTNGSIRVRER